jgi:uncharacterized protein (TIGR03089 family)
MSMSATHPADLLRATLAEDPARPLVTFYDDATGERIELSAKTFDNWVAKTANMLVDGLAAEPGERVVLALPPHWQSAVWLFGCWSAGLVPIPVDPAVLDRTGLDPAVGDTAGPDQAGLDALADTDPQIVVTTASGLGGAADRFPAAGEIVGLSLHPLGGTLADMRTTGTGTHAPPPAGVVDYAAEVRAYGDRFISAALDPAAAALAPPQAAVLTGADLVAAAADAARAWRVPAGVRVLTVAGLHTLDGILAGLLVPMSVSGSVIICRNIDESGLDRRLAMEHVSAVAGLPGLRGVAELLSLPSDSESVDRRPGTSRP